MNSLAATFLNDSDLPRSKETEVGALPIDWDLRELKDLTRQVIDGTHHTPRYVSRGVPFLRVTDIQTPEIDLSALKYVSIEEHTELVKRCSPERGDVLLSKNGTIGIPKVVDWDWPFSIFVSLALIKPRHELLDPFYLEQFFLSDILDEQIRKRSKQGTVTNLHLEEIREFLIPLPPTRDEQAAITRVLSDADALIESLEALIAKKRAIKQGVMHDLLSGRKRLPGFSREWGTKLLENCSAFITKGSTPTTYGFAWVDSGVLFLRSECVATSGLDLTESMMISEGAHTLLKRSEVRGGDILMTITGNVGRVVQLPDDFDRANINQHIARIRISDVNMCPRFVAYTLNQESYRRYYTSILTGQAYPQISLKQVRETCVPAPEITEQKAIAEALSDMDSEVASLKAKTQKAYQIKQGMMQELLTGRVRLV